MLFRASHLTLTEFQQLYGTEQQCHTILVRTRWPQGFICPHCGDTRHSYCAPKQIFQCRGCRKQTSVRAQTIFHGSKIPLKKWFMAMYLIASTQNNIKTIAIAHAIDVDPDTASSMRKKFLKSRSPAPEKKVRRPEFMPVFPR